MGLWSPDASKRDSDEPAKPPVLGLTPLQIIEWIRGAGYRAQADQADVAIRIDSGIAGYNIHVWCYSCRELTSVCDSIQLSMTINANENIPVATVKSFINDFNIRWRYVTLTMQQTGSIRFVIDFMVEAQTNTALFARYFFLFDGLLQEFRQRSAASFSPK